MRAVRALALALAVAVAATVAGCGGSHSTAPKVAGPKLPVGTPGNTAPDSTVDRFFVCYRYLDTSDYDALLAASFHYHFSPQSDPQLVTQYGPNWDRAHEALSYAHLVHGFTNTSGTYVPPVVDIVCSLVNPVVGPDSTHADSTAWYQLVSVSTLNLSMDVASGGGGTVTYNVSAPFVFHLVRGDAAVLGAGQSNAATLWYLSAIDDRSPAIPGLAVLDRRSMPLPASNSTWGQLRALYY